MVTVKELIASTQLADSSKERLQKMMQQIGYRCSDEVDDIVQGLNEVDVAREAALAKLNPRLTARERRALLQTTLPAGGR